MTVRHAVFGKPAEEVGAASKPLHSSVSVEYLRHLYAHQVYAVTDLDRFRTDVTAIVASFRHETDTQIAGRVTNYLRSLGRTL